MARYYRILGVAFLVVLGCFYTAIDMPLSPDVDWLVHGVSFCATIGFVILLLRQSRENGPGEGLGAEIPIKLSGEELRIAIDDIQNNYGEQSCAYFTDVLLGLSRYLVRVDERLVPVPRGAEIETTVTLRLSQEASQSAVEKTVDATAKSATRKQGWLRRAIYSQDELVVTEEDGRYPLVLPVFKSKRGDRLDELVVIDNSTGQHAPRLSRRESSALVAVALYHLIRFTAKTRKLHVPDDESIYGFIVTVCNGGQSRESIKTDLKELFRVENADLHDLVETCTYLNDHYLIVVEVAWPHSNKLMVRVAHFIDDVTPASTVITRMRKRFGLAPNVIEYPMSYAFQAQIYHFQMPAPTDQYIYDHRLEQLSDSKLITQAYLAENHNRPYVRVYGADGRTNAHCYARMRYSANPPTPPDVKSVIEVREVPPGALGAAAMVASALAALILFFTITGIAIDGPSEHLNSANLFNSDIPAVLLALPAFAALLLGHWADQSRLPKSSLSAYSGLLVTFFLSFSTALLFILDANRTFGSRAILTIWRTEGLRPDGSRKGPYFTSDWVWIALSAIALTHALYLIVRLRGELKYYMSLPRSGKSQQTQTALAPDMASAAPARDGARRLTGPRSVAPGA